MDIAGPTQEERTGALVTYILTALFGWLGGLIGWLVWKGKGDFARDQTTEALNFGITTLIAVVVIMILARIVVFFAFLTWIVALLQLIFSIIAAIKANEGERYRYPFALRLIK
jgi:uncharacterized Tic20 family protein